MMRLLTLFAGFLLVFSIMAIPGLAQPCQWFGTLKINGIDGDSILVTAHRNSTGEFLASGWEIVEKGQYFIEVNGSSAGSYIMFKVMGFSSDQEPQLCAAGETVRLDLTASPCRDCDGDGFFSFLWGGNDCNDRNPEVNPDRREVCGNGVDDNCDGLDPSCPSCEENWTCTDWSYCMNGEQMRFCEDQNYCGTTSRKPAQIQVCTIYNAGIVCTDGDLACDGDRLMECFAGQWRQAEACEFGCSDGACSSGGITGFIAANQAAFYATIIMVVMIAGISFFVYRKTRW